MANETFITGFNGAHVSGNSNSKVLGVWFNNNCHHIESIPTNLHKFYPNIIGISIYYCGIRELTGSELNQYKNLQELQLAGNKIERIPGNFFALNPYLKAVRFENNRITHVGTNLFEAIQGNLILLRFANNICVNQDANTAGAVPALINSIRIYCTDSSF
jgi:Leucine-rich repeat (LRR) protein